MISYKLPKRKQKHGSASSFSVCHPGHLDLRSSTKNPWSTMSCCIYIYDHSIDQLLQPLNGFDRNKSVQNVMNVCVRWRISGQIIIIPKPELRGFWGSFLIKPPFRVTSADVVIICPGICLKQSDWAGDWQV